jgi:hypothetical protein
MALGLKNLASNFDLRALAAKVGALEAVVKMLRSKNLEVARYAAKVRRCRLTLSKPS